MASKASLPVLRILCFGDSLTSGHSCMGMIHHPYNEAMESRLAATLPVVKIESDEDGADGDVVTTDLGGTFLSRIQEQFKPGKPKYDWTVVLGGTNDIAFQIDPDRIFNSFKRIYAVPLSHGSKVLALTVPEAGIKGASLRERMGTRRNKLNDLIKNYEKETENFHVLDLHEEVPYYAMSAEDQTRYWDDAIHFTSDGYDLIGQKVAATLVRLITAKGKEEAVPRRSDSESQTTASQSDSGSNTAQPAERGEPPPPPGTANLPPRASGTASDTSPAEVNGKERGEAGVETKPATSLVKKRRKKAFPGDDVLFDEERGNPTVLDRGYVVVRRKDLE